MIWPDDFIDKVIQGDCLEVMQNIPDKSISLIIADPPYNIGKDTWDKIPDYIEWMGEVFKACERVLKDNGSFYWFHNYMPTVAKLIGVLGETRFIFKQFIVWDKYNGTPQSHPYKGALWKQVNSGGKRCFSNAKEYILFYTFQDETGLTTVKLDMNNFTTLRQYFKDYQEALGLSKKQLLEKIGQGVDHCFRWGSSQWDMPTPETYTELGKLTTSNGFLRREYEDLRREYEDLRYTFNQQENNLSIWQFPIPNKKERIRHPSQKSIDLIQHIIFASSNEGDIVLDPFLGSGTTAVACKNLNRHFMGIENEQKYCEIARRRLAEPTQQELSI